MASSLQILPEGDRYENSEGSAHALVVSGMIYLVVAGVFYFAGSEQWARMTAVFGAMNWAWAWLPRWVTFPSR